MKKRNRRLQLLTELAIVLVSFVVLNLLSTQYFARVDLTREGRYTLSETSKKLASQLKEKAYFRIYLEGDLSAKFKRLSNSARDLLYEFRQASGGKIEIDIRNPVSDITAETEKAAVLKQLAGKGLRIMQDIESETAGEEKRNLIVPGGTVSYMGAEHVLNFFNPDMSMDEESNVNRSIEQLEFEFANVLRKCVASKTKTIAFAEGSGELTDLQVKDLSTELSQYYSIDRLNLNVADPASALPFRESLEANPDSAGLILLEKLQARLNSTDLLIIAKPVKDYSMAELYLIDQYLMKGGRIIWMIDPLMTEIDSLLSNPPAIMSMDYGLENINSCLSIYGVKVMPELLMDLNCNRIPLKNQVTGQFEFFDWPYFPIFTSESEHPIVRNLEGLWSQFPSTLKAKARPGIKLTNLLTSSPASKVVPAPATVDLRTGYSLRNPKFKATFNGGTQLTGVLMEGLFRSAYLDYRRNYTRTPFKDSGYSAMMVISDGDIARNWARPSSGEHGILGWDNYTRTLFANKKFLMNSIDYLLDEKDLIAIRSKEIKLRLLDKNRILAEKQKWQFINAGIPLLLVALFGIANMIWRRKRYAS